MELVPEEKVCAEFQLQPQTLREWIEIGLVKRTRSAGRTGFEPEQVRRIWSIVSIQSDLEVNLAGVQIILDLSDQIRELKLALREAMRLLDQQRQLDQFHARILEEKIGPLDWEIEQ